VEGQRQALIIATSSYEDAGLRQLRSPAADAEELVKVLEDPKIGNFKANVLSDSPEARLRREIYSFFSKAERDDLLLLHFSCHGIKNDRGELYFATVDTELETLGASAIPADFVNQQIGYSRSRRIILLLDCCYSGAFSPGLGHRAGSTVEVGERFNGKGRAILTASTSMEYSFEGLNLTEDKSQPSMFTEAVVEGLRSGDADQNGDGRISIDELYEYVATKVRRKTSKQRPQKWLFGFEGELVVAQSNPRMSTRKPLHLLVPESVRLPDAATSTLDEVGALSWENLTSRDALIDRLQILIGKLEFTRMVMEATVSNRMLDDTARIRSIATTTGEDLDTLVGMIEETHLVASNVALHDASDVAVRASQRIKILGSTLDRVEKAGGQRALFDRDFSLFRDLLARIDQMRHDLHEAMDRVGGQEGPLTYVWSCVESISNEAQTTMDLCFEVIRGVLLRDTNLDGGYTQMADALLYELGSATSLRRPAHMVMGRSFQHEPVGPLGTTFPDFSVWSLPLLAHELGHEVERDLHAELQPVLAASIQSLPSRLEEPYVSELFCDAFATFSTGPAFPLSYLSLYASPASESLARFRPDSLTRIQLCIGILRKSGANDRGRLAPFLTVLERILTDGSESAEPGATPTQNRLFVDQMAHLFHVLLSANLPPAVAFDFSDSQQNLILNLARELHGEHSFQPSTQTAIRDVLNAGWYARITANDATIGAKLRRAIKACVDPRDGGISARPSASAAFPRRSQARRKPGR
jgi:hypothetical protein